MRTRALSYSLVVVILGNLIPTYAFKDPFSAHSQTENYWINPTCSIGIGTTYSKGMIRGVLTAISDSITSVEGLLKEGVQSAGPHYDEPEEFDPTLDHSGLWKFSMNEEERVAYFDHNKIRTGDDLVIHFKRYPFKALSPNAIKETDIRIQSLEKIDPEPFDDYFNRNPGMQVEQPHTGPLRKHFEEYGYIVQAQHTGWCLKTYELVFQIARYSNHFINLSIQDYRLYQYATRVLRAGRPVRIRFTLLDSVGRLLTTVKSPRIMWSIETTTDL